MMRRLLCVYLVALGAPACTDVVIVTAPSPMVNSAPSGPPNTNPWRVPCQPARQLCGTPFDRDGTPWSGRHPYP